MEGRGTGRHSARSLERGGGGGGEIGRCSSSKSPRFVST